MQAFIVRPFGEKTVTKTDGTTATVNFDNVEKMLIQPALRETDIKGGTTGKIFEAGDIREDMFSLLLTADIVIADITILNANVFYELGIRHAVKDKYTILIKCSGYSDTPFDILGYRYLSYNADKPEESVHQLAKTIKETIAEENRKDSPVFNTLPNLKPQDPELLMILPGEFEKDVKIAGQTKDIGRLALLASEAKDFVWEIKGLKLIGECLYSLQAYSIAVLIWERVKSINQDDMQANDVLSTIYQRLASTATRETDKQKYLALSDMVLNHVLQEDKSLSSYDIAQRHALRGRNAKARWTLSWKKAAAEDRQKVALLSQHFTEAIKGYASGYYQCLNHYYSGINVLALTTMRLSLAEQQPEHWQNLFDSDEAAAAELLTLNKQKKDLVILLENAIKSAKHELPNDHPNMIWVNLSYADWLFLTLPYSERNVHKIADNYAAAIEGEENNFNTDAAMQQLLLFDELKIFPEFTKAALGVFNTDNANQISPVHYMLFTGHMIDKEGRKVARFPADKESVARDKIKEIVQAEKERTQGKIIGIAGGACGGDILFHETCNELGIPTELFLALPREEFIESSVGFAGNDWIKRFDAIRNKAVAIHQLTDSKQMPDWLSEKDNYNIWERNNLWILNNALVNGGENMTMIALWDGKAGDGPGGTQHMVEIAQSRGAAVIIIHTKELFGL